MTALLTAGTAGRLGAAAPLDLPVLRIVLALLACLLIAFLAIILLRQRAAGRAPLPRLHRGRLAARQIEVIEVRRISVHAEINLVRHRDREYLLLLQSGSARVLSERETPGAADPS